MNKAEYKKYNRKWEAVKKNIFTALQNGDTNTAFEELNKVKDDPEFKTIPTPPDDEMNFPDSPMNELLVLLAHKKIFFTLHQKLEERFENFLNNTDTLRLAPESQEFINQIETAIDNEKQMLLKTNEGYSIDNNGYLMDDDNKRIYIDIKDLIPDFPVERMHAIPFIEKLIEEGADPISDINTSGAFYRLLVGLDSEAATKYVLTKVTDEQLMMPHPRAGDYICHALQTRANKSFAVIVEEKENIIDFNKSYIHMAGQNLLHLAMGNFLPNEAAFLISKGTSLTQRGHNGNYPADVIPNEEICAAYEYDKNEIREDSPILSDGKISLFKPKDFKPHKAAIPSNKSDAYYGEMAELTKACLKKEKEASNKDVKKFRNTF